MKFTPIHNFTILVHFVILIFTFSQLFSLESTLETIAISNHHLQLQPPARQVAGQRVSMCWAGQGGHQPGPQPQRPWRGRGRALRRVAAPDPQPQGSAASSVVRETNSQRATSLFSLFLLTVANIADIFVRKKSLPFNLSLHFWLKTQFPIDLASSAAQVRSAEPRPFVRFVPLLKTTHTN